MNCKGVRDTSLALKDVVMQYRLLILFIYLTIINFILQYISKHIIPLQATYSRLSPEANEEIAVRTLQLWFGPVIALAGYTVLLFDGSTGCNATEIYVYWIGGAWLAVIDLHEYIRRWPLPAPVLLHHIVVFGIVLCFFDFEALPPSPDDPVDMTTVLFLSNIGLCWISDYFHAIFRTSSSLTVIETVRRAYLIMASVRIFNIALMITTATRAGLSKSWLGLALTGVMSIAYSYNTFMAVSFVWKFDCAGYFKKHQEAWAIVASPAAAFVDSGEANREGESLAVHGSKRRVSLLAEEDLPLSARESVASRNSSFWNQTFAIETKQAADSVATGLRGGRFAANEVKNHVLLIGAGRGRNSEQFFRDSAPASTAW